MDHWLPVMYLFHHADGHQRSCRRVRHQSSGFSRGSAGSAVQSCRSRRCASDAQGMVVQQVRLQSGPASTPTTSRLASLMYRFRTPRRTAICLRGIWHVMKLFHPAGFSPLSYVTPVASQRPSAPKPMATSILTFPAAPPRLRLRRTIFQASVTPSVIVIYMHAASKPIRLCPNDMRPFEESVYVHITSD